MIVRLVQSAKSATQQSHTRRPWSLTSQAHSCLRSTSRPCRLARAPSLSSFLLHPCAILYIVHSNPITILHYSSQCAYSQWTTPWFSDAQILNQMIRSAIKLTPTITPRSLLSTQHTPFTLFHLVSMTDGLATTSLPRTFSFVILRKV